MRSLITGILLLGIAVGGSGCATMDTVKDAPQQEGISRSFNAPYDSTVAAALKALAGLNVNVTSSSQDGNGTTYLVSKSLSAWSWGEVGRVYVEKSVAPPTTVFVDWKKRDALQITGTGSDEASQAIFNAIQQDL